MNCLIQILGSHALSSENQSINIKLLEIDRYGMFEADTDISKSCFLIHY